MALLGLPSNMGSLSVMTTGATGSGGGGGGVTVSLLFLQAARNKRRAIRRR